MLAELESASPRVQANQARANLVAAQAKYASHGGGLAGRAGSPGEKPTSRRRRRGTQRCRMGDGRSR